MTTDRNDSSLDCMRVLNPRSLLSAFREFHNKEWWYTGVYDPAAGIYVSWYFVRVNVTDKFVMTVFDEAADVGGTWAPPRIRKTCRLEPQAPGATAGLEIRRRDCKISYRAGHGHPWRLQVEAPTLAADLEIAPTTPPFTKFDNAFQDRYAIVHYFHGRADGVVTVPQGKTYRLSKALVYQDHCYGRVPSRTGWHWIAVQNASVAVTSLVNYGAYAQRYTQAWFGADPSAAPTSPRPNEWIRLDQNVSFELQAHNDQMHDWTVSSPDLLLDVKPRRSVTDLTRIPPLVNLKHTEFFVEASGRVRVDGRWVDTGLLYGVMEQHHGRW